MKKEQKSESLISKIEINDIEKPVTLKEQIAQPVNNSVIDDKNKSNLKIELNTQIIQQISNSISSQSKEIKVFNNEELIDNPQEILSKVIDTLSSLKNPTINDIQISLINSGLEMESVEKYLISIKQEIESDLSKKEEMEKEKNGLSKKIKSEKQKNYFVKLLNIKGIKKNESEFNQILEDFNNLNFSLSNKKKQAEELEYNIKKIDSLKERLVILGMEQLFKSVIEENIKLEKDLLKPEIKEQLNNNLITTKVLPELDKLKKENIITEEEAKEFTELIKVRLAEGRLTQWDDTDEKKETFKLREQRLDELDKKSGYKLNTFEHYLNIDGNQSADEFYDEIIKIIIQENAKEEIEKINKNINITSNPKLQKRINETSQMIVNQENFFYDGQNKYNGLIRWNVVKDFTKSLGLLDDDVFNSVERDIINKLFYEQLSPGGQESWGGTAAAGKMELLGNPEAIPLMLQHIEATGSGHTNAVVVYSIEYLLKNSDVGALEKVLKNIPKKDNLLLEILADKDSFMNRFGRYNNTYGICSLLQSGDLTIAKEKLTKILETGGFAEDRLKDYFLLNMGNTPEVMEQFMKNRNSVEEIIIESKLNIWAQSADKILSAYVNPRNGDPSLFPKRIIEKGLGISDNKVLEKIEHIFETKTFQGSGFEREAFLDGIILLNSKEDGGIVLEELLDAYRGTRNDPSRIRKIFQILSTLNDFGEFNLYKPSNVAIDEIDQKIINFQTEFSKTQDKGERKIIKDKIETLNINRQNLTGLKGIEDLMSEKVSEILCKRLNLPQEYNDKMKNNLDKLLKSGIFEIIPSLMGKYEKIKEKEVGALLKTITTHIIEDDFKSWKYSHEQSEKQLSGLDEDKKEFWKGTLDPVTIDIEFSQDEKERRMDEIKASQEIIKNAKEHILVSNPNYTFSKEKVQSLLMQVSELTEQIKKASAEEIKKQLISEKRAMSAEAALINGILEIENISLESYSKERILTQSRELYEGITELNIPLAGLDIQQVEKIFTVGNIKKVIARESDDPIALLKVGIEPQETCQSWRNGGYNECLLAYVADSNKKVINISDGGGQIIARSIIKLTKQRESNDYDSKTERNTLLIEKPYSLLPNNEVYKAYALLLLKKAQGLDASITFGVGLDEKIINIFKEEAKSFNYVMKNTKLQVFVPQSLNKYEYSDTLGGKIEYFDNYKQINVITFEKETEK